MGAGLGQDVWSASWRDHLVLKYIQSLSEYSQWPPLQLGKPDSVPKQHSGEALAPPLQGCGHWEALPWGHPTLKLQPLEPLLTPLSCGAKPPDPLTPGHPQAILPLSSSHLPPAHTQVLSRCPPGALPGFRSPAPPPCLPLLCCVHRLQAPDGNHLAQYAGLSLRAVEDTGRGLKWDPAHSCHGVKGGTLVT